MRGRGKGAQFERDICRALSKWMGAKRGELWYWRTAMSGGKATIMQRVGLKANSQAGDIGAIRAYGQPLTDLYYIECKNHRNLDLKAAFFGQGKLVNFMAKTRQEAIQHRRLPMLIVHESNRRTLVGFQMMLAPQVFYSTINWSVVFPISGFAFFDFETMLGFDNKVFLAMPRHKHRRAWLESQN